MTTHITRRTLAKSAAWSAPLILATAAVPAYAASQVGPYRAESSDLVDLTRNEAGDQVTNTVSINNVTGEGANVPGFTVYVPDEEQGTDLTVTREFLYYILTPKELKITDFEITSSSPWNYEGPRDIATFEINGGTIIDSSDYDIHLFAFTGDNVLPIMLASERASWPGSTFQATGESTTDAAVEGPFTIYHGYWVQYETRDGYKDIANHVVGEEFAG